MLILTLVFDEQAQAISYTGTMPLLAQQLIQEIVIQGRVKAELLRVQDGKEKNQDQRDSKEEAEKPAEAEG